MIYAFDILHYVNEVDSVALQAMGNTPSRFLAGFCYRPPMRFVTQTIPTCPAVILIGLSHYLMSFIAKYRSRCQKKSICPYIHSLKRSSFTDMVITVSGRD